MAETLAIWLGDLQKPQVNASNKNFILFLDRNVRCLSMKNFLDNVNALSKKDDSNEFYTHN